MSSRTPCEIAFSFGCGIGAVQNTPPTAARIAAGTTAGTLRHRMQPAVEHRRGNHSAPEVACEGSGGRKLLDRHRLQRRFKLLQAMLKLELFTLQLIDLPKGQAC